MTVSAASTCTTQSDGDGDYSATSGYLEGAAGNLFATQIVIADSADIYSLKGSTYSAGTGTYNVKAVIYDSSYNLLHTAAAGSADLGAVYEWESVFSSPVTLSAGTYYFGYVHDHTANVRFYNTATTGTTYRDRGGSYATPPDPMATNDGTYTDNLRVFARECN